MKNSCEKFLSYLKVFLTLGFVSICSTTFGMGEDLCQPGDVNKILSVGNDSNAATKLSQLVSNPLAYPSTPIPIFDHTLLYEFLGTTHLPASPFSGEHYFKALDIELGAQVQSPGKPVKVTIQLFSIHLANSGFKTGSEFIQKMAQVFEKMAEFKIPTLAVGILYDPKMKDFFARSSKFKDWKKQLASDEDLFGLMSKGHISVRKLDCSFSKCPRAIQTQIVELKTKLKLAGLYALKPEIFIDQGNNIYLMGVNNLEMFDSAQNTPETVFNLL